MDRKYNFESSNLETNIEDFREKDKEIPKDIELNSYNNSRIGSSIKNTTAGEDKHSGLNFNSNRLNSALENKKVSEIKKDDFASLNKKFSSEKRSFRYEQNKGNLSN